MPRRVTALLATAVATTALLTGPTAAASPIEVDKDLTYSCEFPYLVPQDIEGNVNVSLPDSVRVGERFRANDDVTISLTLNKDIVTVLNLLEAATFEGTARADVDAEINGLEATIGIPGLRIPRTEVPIEQAMTVSMSGTMPTLTAYQPGSLELAAGDEFVAAIEAHQADGTPIEISPFDVPCTITTTDPPQDRHLATIPIVG